MLSECMYRIKVRCLHSHAPDPRAVTGLYLGSSDANIPSLLAVGLKQHLSLALVSRG